MSDMENNILQIVSYGGDASSKALEALDLYAEGNTTAALGMLDDAQDALILAHKSQYAILAENEDDPVSVVMAHAMDICSIAANNIVFAKKLITLFERDKP